METNVIGYKIVRETSKYNKYIKWFARTYRPDGSLLSSFGYRTQREARESIPKDGDVKIGDRTVRYEYREIQG
jgi:hypothetical protein